MKKGIFILLFTLITLSSSLSQEHEHIWEETEVEGEMVCSICGTHYFYENKNDTTQIISKTEWSKTRNTILTLIYLSFFGLIVLFAIILKKEDIKRRKRSIELLYDCMESDLKKRKSIVEKLVIEHLLKEDLKNNKIYERVFFIYNGGKLRTEYEIQEYDYNEKLKQFENKKSLVNWIFGLTPFLTGFVTVFFKCPIPYVRIILGALVGGFLSLLGMLVGHLINISKAKGLGLNEDEPCVVQEHTELKIGIVSTVAAGASIVHNTKQAVKDITDVDSWKEFK